MSTGSFEERLNRLEQKGHELDGVVQTDTESPAWWHRVSGAFKNDVVSTEARKLAREAQSFDDDGE